MNPTRLLLALLLGTSPLAQAQDAPPVAPPPDASTVVATVDGTPITLALIDDHLDRSMGEERYALKPPQLLEARRDALAQLVRVMIVEQELARRKVEVPREDVAAQMADFRRQLTERGQRFEEVLRKSHSNVWYFERVLRGTIGLYKLVNAQVTDDQVRHYYEANAKRFAAQVQVRHVLVLTIDPATRLPLDEDRRQAAKQKIAACARELAADGSNFEALIARYGEDPRATAGGLLPPFSLSDAQEKNMDPGFVDAAMALRRKGEVSRIVLSRYGYHLIQLVSRWEPTWEDARQPCVQQIVENAMHDLLQAAKVTFLVPELAPPKASQIPPDWMPGRPGR